jgi:hypothetical protein
MKHGGGDKKQGRGSTGSFRSFRNKKNKENKREAAVAKVRSKADAPATKAAAAVHATADKATLHGMMAADTRKRTQELQCKLDEEDLAWVRRTEQQVVVQRDCAS